MQKIELWSIRNMEKKIETEKDTWNNKWKYNFSTFLKQFYTNGVCLGWLLHLGLCMEVNLYILKCLSVILHNRSRKW